ncbi:MAG TPA: Panacea domain-containing protein [Gaiellaceae bacterium]|jgi:hypothetical protein|nr:Panacea domain-containing protein [Gaiellaceae bacterium]
MAGGRDYKQARLENLVLYFAARSRADDGYGKIKLNKLLFRSDFEAFRLLGSSITGEEYKRQELGPVAAHLPSLLRRFEEKGVMAVEAIPAGPYTRQVPVVTDGHSADLSIFSKDELAIAERTLEELRAHGGKSVSDWSHEVSVGWRVKQTGKIIPYSSAALSIRALSPKADRALTARFVATA